MTKLRLTMFTYNTEYRWQSGRNKSIKNYTLKVNDRNFYNSFGFEILEKNKYKPHGQNNAINCNDQKSKLESED